MRNARQRPFKSSPQLPSKEGRGVNIAAFFAACLDCSSALSWVFCCWAWKSHLCSHWTLSPSNETDKDDTNYFLLSPVFRLRVKPSHLPWWHGEVKPLHGQSSWVCTHKCCWWTCWGSRCFCRARAWEFFPFSTLLAMDYSPQGIRDLNAIQCKIFGKWKQNRLEAFRI